MANCRVYGLIFQQCLKRKRILRDCTDLFDVVFLTTNYNYLHLQFQRADIVDCLLWVFILLLLRGKRGTIQFILTKHSGALMPFAIRARTSGVRKYSHQSEADTLWLPGMSCVQPCIRQNAGLGHMQNSNFYWSICSTTGNIMENPLLAQINSLGSR